MINIREVPRPYTYILDIRFLSLYTKNNMTETIVGAYCHCNAIRLDGEICNKKCLSVWGGKCPKHRNSKFILCKGCGEHGTQSQYGYCSANKACRYKSMYQSRINKLNKKSADSIQIVSNELESNSESQSSAEGDQ